MNTLTPLEIMQAVDHFYSNSWAHLIALTGFITVVIPLITLLIQNRIFRHEEQKLRKDIDSIISERINALFTSRMEKFTSDSEGKFSDVESKIDKKLKEESEKLERAIFRARASTYHIQANQNFKLGEPDKGTDSIIDSLTFYVKSRDKFNLRNAVGILLNVGIPSLKRKHLFTSEKFIERIGDTITDLEKINQDNDLRDLIERLEVSLERLKDLKNKEPNKAVEPTIMAVTDAAAQPPRQP